MQFDQTQVLILLLAIPVLYALYARYNSKKKDAILKFSSLNVITKAVTGKSFARKHLPFILLMAAIGTTVIALADLQIPTLQTQTADTRGRNISIVLDGSESMAATDYKPSRFEAAKQSITKLIQASDPRDYVGIVLFETGATTVSYLTHDKQSAINAVMAVKQSSGATAVGDGLALGIDMVRTIPNRDRIVILLSDGVHNSGRTTPEDAIAYAHAANVTVHAVGMGSIEPVFLKDDMFGDPQYAELDEDILVRIAGMTDGTFSKALDENTLDAIFADIKAELKYDIQYQSLRDWFIAASLALLVATAYVIYGRYRIVA